MLHTFKSLVARAALLFVIAAGIGFGILAAGMAVILGAVMLIGLRLARWSFDQAPAGPSSAASGRAVAAPAPTDQPA